MKCIWLAAAAIWVLAIGGCTSGKPAESSTESGAKAYVGTYGIQVSAEDSARFDENLEGMKHQEGGAEMAAKAKSDYEASLATSALTIKGDGTWEMVTPQTSGPGKASGTYVVQGNKLTLSTTTLGDQRVGPQDQPEITFTFSPEAGTLTAQKGDQTLVYKRK